MQYIYIYTSIIKLHPKVMHAYFYTCVGKVIEIHPNSVLHREAVIGIWRYVLKDQNLEFVALQRSGNRHT